MEIINVIILSFIQGVTEFLPISSSSHLVLLSELSEFPDQGLGFDIALHAGSLLAILIYFKDEIKKIFIMTDDGRNYLKLMIFASIPLPIIGVIFIDYVSIYMRNVQPIAIMTIIFALALFFVDKNRKESKKIINCSYSLMFFIGLMQALAIMPGVSRSGVVITAALLVGFTRKDSIRISFLLSIPAIFMASTYQTVELLSTNEVIIVKDYILGFLLSFVFSYLTIKLFISTINKVSFSPYIIYRIILGTALLII
jgi:undecaprenyl-diphosphatase